MSIKAINWAWSLDSLDMPKGYVLMALADAANDEGYCWPSQEELARKSKQSARSVRRHISVLVDLGLVEVETRVRRGWGNGRSSNGYYLNLELTDADITAGHTQPANLAICGDPEESLPVDNLYNRRSHTTGQIGHMSPQPVTGDRSQVATGGRLYPYGSLNHQEEPPNQTIPAGNPQSNERGVVRSGVVGDQDLVQQAVLVRKCLPASMHVIDAQLLPGVALLLQERLDAGWSPNQIQMAMDQSLPAQVSRLGALVAKRLQVNVIPELAPEALRKAGLKRQASAQRSEPMEDVDPRFQSICDQIRLDHPDLSARKVAELAHTQTQGEVGEPA